MADDDERATRRAVLGVLMPGFTGVRTPPEWVCRAGADGLAGVVLFAHNTPTPSDAAALTAGLHAVAPGLIVAIDEEGGDVTRLQARRGSSLPGAWALGAVGDVALTQAAGAALGRLLWAAGIDLDLAPVLDVASNPLNPVIGTRAFADSPRQVAAHGGAFVRGLQAGGVAVCGKHFPGHGDTAVDSHLGLPRLDVSSLQLRQRELTPFVTLAHALDSAMLAHLVVPIIGPEPASLEPAAYSLARAIGLTGPLLTDALDMRAVSDGADIGEASVRALEAGADLLCLGTTADRNDRVLFESAYDAVTWAVRDGRLSLDRLCASIARTDALRAALSARRAGHRAPALADAEAELEAVGGEAARRAVRVHPGGVGVPPKLALSALAALGRASSPGCPQVVDLRTGVDHARGSTAPHVAEALRARWPGIEQVPAEGRPTSGRLVVAVTRQPFPGTAELARLQAWWVDDPSMLVVHTGLPDGFPSLPGGGPGVVWALGTGRVNAERAVDALVGLLRDGVGVAA